ncbi:helix-turn-helix domain-containing protein [Rhodohalobacter sp. 8-1]|uniref:helix-turn-helix domain-containing protein n=1 Tax=Rhodohalobacter sp. 8-1 TaxID=3131972 RepID=UPI0030ED398B
MPSLGRDLQSIRKHLGFSVEDIQNATKLPADTIRSIEDGTIFSESKEINTYIRSFVRTYGRALKLDIDLLSRALDQEELGNYTDLLLQNFPELKSDKPEQETESSSDEETRPSKGKKKKRSPSFTFAGGDEKKSTSDSSKSSGSSSKKRGPAHRSSPPDVRSIDWAGLGKDFKKRRTQPPVWMISAGLIIILIVAAAVLISQFGFFSSDEQVPVAPPTTDIEEPARNQDLTLDLSEDITEDTTDVTEVALSDTLYLTLYAATGRLDPVRVWSDLKPRIDPYWLEQGTAFNFEFADTIRVAGSYSNMLMFMNGHRIENFRGQYYNPEENAVELTRSIFDSDPRWASPVPFELPENVAEPDTLIDRPSF